MKIKHLTGFIAGLLMVSTVGLSQATLIDKGDGLFYDDVLNITWLDEKLLTGWGEVTDIEMALDTINTEGGWMSYGGVWVDGRGFDDWRMPTIDELVALGGYLESDMSPFTRASHTGHDSFWSSDWFMKDYGDGFIGLTYYTYRFYDDMVHETYWNAGLLSLAVRDGFPVPEPATILLFGAGLAGLAGSRLRRKKQ